MMTMTMMATRHNGEERDLGFSIDLFVWCGAVALRKDARNPVPQAEGGPALGEADQQLSQYVLRRR